MNNQELQERFVELSAPLIADACLRLGLALRVAPTGIHPIIRGLKLAGCARPVRHYGSVDIFLEAIADSHAGDVLVIDVEMTKKRGKIGKAKGACKVQGEIVSEAEVTFMLRDA